MVSSDHPESRDVIGACATCATSQPATHWLNRHVRSCAAEESLAVWLPSVRQFATARPMPTLRFADRNYTTNSSHVGCHQCGNRQLRGQSQLCALPSLRQSATRGQSQLCGPLPAQQQCSRQLCTAIPHCTHGCGAKTINEVAPPSLTAAHRRPSRCIRVMGRAVAKPSRAVYTKLVCSALTGRAPPRNSPVIRRRGDFSAHPQGQSLAGMTSPANDDTLPHLLGAAQVRQRLPRSQTGRHVSKTRLNKRVRCIGGGESAGGGKRNAVQSIVV